MLDSMKERSPYSAASHTLSLHWQRSGFKSSVVAITAAIHMVAFVCWCCCICYYRHMQPLSLFTLTGMVVLTTDQLHPYSDAVYIP